VLANMGRNIGNGSSDLRDVNLRPPPTSGECRTQLDIALGMTVHTANPTTTKAIIGG